MTTKGLVELDSAIWRKQVFDVGETVVGVVRMSPWSGSGSEDDD